MNSFKYIQLGSDAIAFMRECLAQGHTLAKFLTLRPDLDHGTIFAPVPPAIELDPIRNFRHGPLLPSPTTNNHVEYSDEEGKSISVVPVPSTNHILEQLIRNYLKQSNHKVCVFEDALATASDPYLKDLSIRMLTLNKEVYYVLLSTDNSEDAVRRTIRQAANPHPGLIAMVTTMTGDDFSFRRGVITRDGLKRLSDKAEKIILGAYHGEGYLIWEKPQNSE